MSEKDKPYLAVFTGKYWQIYKTENNETLPARFKTLKEAKEELKKIIDKESIDDRTQ